MTPSRVAALIDGLRRGAPRREALRQAGIDPVRFAAEYRRSPNLRALIIEAEDAASTSPAARDFHRQFILPMPRSPDMRAKEKESLPPVAEARDRTPKRFNEPTLWLIVLAPLMLAILLLALGAGSGLPSLTW